MRLYATGSGWKCTGTGNTIFSRSSRGTVFQYNEGYLNRSRDYDGSLYDADMESPGCIFQYSYSHDNTHGLFWMCTEPEHANVIVRYNISHNDKGIIFCVNYANTSCYISNNVFFGIHPDSEPEDPHIITDDPRFVAPGSGGLGIDTLDGIAVSTGYEDSLEVNKLDGFRRIKDSYVPGRCSAILRAHSAK